MQLFERVRIISTKVARSQTELANRLNLSVSTFSGYLNEKRQDNLWPLLPKILGAYPKIRRDWLYFGEGEMLHEDSDHLPRTELEKTLLRRVADLEAEQQEQRRLIQRLETRLLVDGVGDKPAAANIGKTASGHEYSRFG